MIKHYVGEVGAVIIVDTQVDITSASTHSLKVKKPDGTLVTWDADLYSINSNETTRLKYVTIAGDFDQTGKYLVQPDIVLPEWSVYGETVNFIVHPNFG